MSISYLKWYLSSMRIVFLGQLIALPFVQTDFHRRNMLLVTFLACPRKVTQRRAPGENSLRHAWSSSVHFGNSPFGSDSPKCFTLRLGRLAKFSHGSHARNVDPENKEDLINIVCSILPVPSYSSTSRLQAVCPAAVNSMST